MLLAKLNELSLIHISLKLKMTAAEVIKKLMALGIMATVNDVIDYDTCLLYTSRCV